mgnify:CR=1 FL=1
MYQVVIFDFDYTLGDSTNGIVSYYQQKINTFLNIFYEILYKID